MPCCDCRLWEPLGSVEREKATQGECRCPQLSAMVMYFNAGVSCKHFEPIILTPVVKTSPDGTPLEIVSDYSPNRNPGLPTETLTLTEEQKQDLIIRIENAAAAVDNGQSPSGGSALTLNDIKQAQNLIPRHTDPRPIEYTKEMEEYLRQQRYWAYQRMLYGESHEESPAPQILQRFVEESERQRQQWYAQMDRDYARLYGEYVSAEEYNDPSPYGPHYHRRRRKHYWGEVSPHRGKIWERVARMYRRAPSLRPPIEYAPAIEQPIETIRVRIQIDAPPDARLEEIQELLERTLQDIEMGLE